MMSNNKESVLVLIATLFCRKKLLLEKSLKSVYSQKNIQKKNVKILIVTDDIDSVFSIQKNCDELHSAFGFASDEMQTFVLPNTKTKGHSGTGSWNTGIEFNREKLKCSYIAILDDDDEWNEDYIFEHLDFAKKNKYSDAGIFSHIEWVCDDIKQKDKLDEVNSKIKFSKSDLVLKIFLSGILEFREAIFL